MESFFGNLQLELLDQRTWATRRELASAIFEWIQAWYNPARRHPALGYHSPISYERIRQMLPNAAACSAQPTRPGHRGSSPARPAAHRRARLPPPEVTLDMGKVWKREDVQAWAEKHGRAISE